MEEKKVSSKVIGIDLGTANSCVSILTEDGYPEVILDANGSSTQPSVFAYGQALTPIVGRDAQKKAPTNRLNTIFAVKRLIGRKFHSDEVTEARKKLPYTIIEADNGDAWVEVDGEQLSPEQISSYIVVHMKEIAEAYLGETVNKAVITVPAHFNDAQRQATKDAGEIAGLKVLNIINEPTAAALAYGLGTMEDNDSAESKERTIAVFDLGGGTFDITILGLHDGKFTVKSTNGDTYLGGEDFDIALVNYLLEHFRQTEGFDLSSDKSAMERLKSAARNAKHVLSEEKKVEVIVPNVCASAVKGRSPGQLTLILDRRDLEKIFTNLLNSIDLPCIEAMEDAGLAADDVDEVILVGGMTKMPLIRKQCEKIFGKVPIDEINPDTAVAAGAAIQAGLMQGMLKGLSLQDVTSLAFGIEVQGGKTHTMLEKNSQIPCKETKIFTTSSPNQTEITIHVVQGEHKHAAENKSLGLFKLTDIPAAPRGVPRIEMSLEVDEDGLVHVSAKDLETGQKKKIDIMPSSGLEDNLVDKLKEENRVLKKETARRASREKDIQQEVRRKLRVGELSAGDASALNEAQGRLKAALFATQFKLDMEGIAYRGDSRQKLENILKLSRKTLDSSTVIAELNASVIELELMASELDNFLEAA